MPATKKIILPYESFATILDTISTRKKDLEAFHRRAFAFSSEGSHPADILENIGNGTTRT